jgi:L-ascorbate metabolism protein UlaG (beta-lactamase superfamily)
VRPESIAWNPDALGAASRTSVVRVRWLGTAGFAIEHDGYTVLVDPYVTRASLVRLIFSSPVPDARAVARHVPCANAIVVGHTHLDHALDVPAIALATGAKVFGSRSAATLCRVHGVPEERVEVVEREAGSPCVVREVGPFRLRFVPSAHSRFFFGRVPYPGEIADCGALPMRTNQYRCGAVFGVEIQAAGRTIFHLGSAELVDATLDATHVDLCLCCVAGWTSSDDFPERVARKLSPAAVLLSHWDDFFRPLDLPARALPAVQLPRLVERFTRAAKDVKLGTLPLLGEVLL